MRNRQVGAAALITLMSIVSAVRASEPNETFFDATVLPAGVLAVSDGLTTPDVSFPDTLVGYYGLFGGIDGFDDDSSPYGDGTASAIYGIPTNSGSIDFAITGYPDTGFFGGHSESGAYEAYVTVYDFFGDEVDSFTIDGSLSPGAVDDYSYSDFNWLNGRYDVEIDNAVGGAGDVDFFTFTGLTPGDEFSAETFDPSGSGIDTVMGWYDDSGVQIDFNDDIPNTSTVLSLITGTVPASGKLTFGVTGYPDYDFVGDHLQLAPYELVVSVPDAGLAGDYNVDSVVDAADYTVWRDSGGPQSEYDTWAANYGATAPAAAVPEPAAALLCVVAAASAFTRRSRWRTTRG